MLLLSLIVLSFTTVVICISFYESLSLIDIISIFFVSVFSINIITSETLSILNKLSSPWLYLTVQTIISTVVYLVALKIKKWKPQKIFQTVRFHSSTFTKGDWILLTLIGLVLLIPFYVGLKTPPNNLDSLHTHLTRVYYWIQNGSLNNWSATGLFQLIYPINAHLQEFWLFLFTKNENVFFIVQWFSLLVTCFLIYDIGRLLTLTQSQSLISVSVLISFPVVLLQVYSVQNDLVVVALSAIILRSLVRYLKLKLISDLILIMLALVLALGVKQTAFFTLPFIAIVLFGMLRSKKIGVGHVPWLTLIIPMFLVFSAYKYYQNISTFNSFFGVKNLLSNQHFTTQIIFDKALYNTPRYFYNFMDFGGLGDPIEYRLNIIKSTLFKSVFSKSRIDIQSTQFLAPEFDDSERFSYDIRHSLSEDTAWFGPSFTILLPISLIIVLFQKERKRKTYTIGALIYFLTYFLLILIQRPGWDPYQGRYFILAIFPLVPIFGLLLPQKRILQIAVSTALCLSCFYISINTLLFNSSKPIITARSLSTFQNKIILPLPENTRFELIIKNFLVKRTNELVNLLPQRESILSIPYYEQLFYSSTSTINVINWFNSIVPKSEPIYVIMDRDPLEYALFGVNLSRQVHPTQSLDDVPKNSYILIEDSSLMNIPGFTFIDTNTRYSIFIRK